MKAYKIISSRNENYKKGMYILETEDDLLYTHNPADQETGEPFYGSWTDSIEDYGKDKDTSILVEEYWYPKIQKEKSPNETKTYRKRVKYQWAGEGDVVQENMTEQAVKADYTRRGYVSGNVYYECEQTDCVIDIDYLPASQEWKFEETGI